MRIRPQSHKCCELDLKRYSSLCKAEAQPELPCPHALHRTLRPSPEATRQGDVKAVTHLIDCGVETFPASKIDCQSCLR